MKTFQTSEPRLPNRLVLAGERVTFQSEMTLNSETVEIDENQKFKLKINCADNFQSKPTNQQQQQPNSL